MRKKQGLWQTVINSFCASLTASHSSTVLPPTMWTNSNSSLKLLIFSIAPSTSPFVMLGAVVLRV